MQNKNTIFIIISLMLLLGGIVLYINSNTQNSENIFSITNKLKFILVSESILMNERSSTGGISWVDFDGDGDDDIFVTNGYDVSKSPNEPQTNWLYENINGTFRLITTELSEREGYSSGSAWADMDNDGDLDVFVPNQKGQDNFLFINDGKGKFKFMGKESPSTGGGLSFASTWGDIDNDGFVDLFVSNGGLSGLGADFLYHNNKGKLMKLIEKSPVTTDTLQSGGATFVDYDLDGDLDLYIGGNPIRMFRNDGNGNFEHDRKVVFVNNQSRLGLSFSGAWGDFDNDGDLDLFQVFDEGEPNRLFTNLGGGKFKRTFKGDATSEVSSAYYSHWVDLNNDGFLDIIVANWGQPPFIYINKNGLSLEKVIFPNLEKRPWYASMVASSDYDNDGDIDFIVGNWPVKPGEGEENLLFNNHGPVGNYIGVRFKGIKSNRSGIGVRAQMIIKDSSGGIRTITRDVRSQDGWRGQSSLELLFGLGEAIKAEKIIIYWPSGIIQEIANIKAGQKIIIEESE